jgi:hypothetical protein
MNVARGIKTHVATPLRTYGLQPLITGFIALLSATVGEPTCVRPRPFRVCWIRWLESWLGVIRSLAPRRELCGAG